MQQSIIVFDDFYEDPMEVRRAALRLDYPASETWPSYLGRKSKQKLLIGGIEQIVSRIVNEPLAGARNAASCHCGAALATDDDDRLRSVYIDADVWWSGVLYLTLPEHCQGGVELYRQKETASDRAPLHPSELARCVP